VLGSFLRVALVISTPNASWGTRAVMVRIPRYQQQLLLSFFVLRSFYSNLTPDRFTQPLATRHRSVELRLRTSPGRCPSTKRSSVISNCHYSRRLKAGRKPTNLPSTTSRPGQQTLARLRTQPCFLASEEYENHSVVTCSVSEGSTAL